MATVNNIAHQSILSNSLVLGVTDSVFKIVFAMVPS